MMRHCNGQDPNIRTRDGVTGNCGRRFDDVNHWTTCPHDEFPINPMTVELAAASVDGTHDGMHQHDDGTWHPDGGGDQDDTDAFIAAETARYMRAAHAVQTGVATEMRWSPGMCEPKQLRVGVNTSKVEQAALVTLLIDLGLFTAAQYTTAMADAMEAEKDRAEQRISEQLGTKVNLS